MSTHEDSQSLVTIRHLLRGTRTSVRIEQLIRDFPVCRGGEKRPGVPVLLFRQPGVYETSKNLSSA